MGFAYSLRRRLLDHALAEEARVIHGVVLEVGSGQGPRRGHFVPPVDRCAHWWYVDIAPRVRPHVIGDSEALPLRDACVDTVVSLEVLEYVRRPHVALAEMYRVLRPAGHLVLSVPFVHRMDAPADLWRFSEHGLREVLAAAGFEVVVLRAQGYALTAAAHLVLSALVQRRRRIERWALGVFALPLVVAARLERVLVSVDGVLASATTGYLAVGRK